MENAAHSGRQNAAPEADRGIAMTAYSVKVYTGTADGAGTNANVYITLHGATASSPECELDNGDNNFEAGDVDTFSLSLGDLGELSTVRIRHDNSGTKPGWYLNNIEINDSSTGKDVNFPCYRWLATDEDDGAIDRTLTAE